jgi:TRAP-type C4-dicarboxylate transport system permease small subunit
MKLVRATFDGLFKVVVVLNMVMLVAIVLITAANVFGRYVLNAPIFWAEELCTRFMLTLGMLSAACGVSMHSHMVIEIFTMRASAKTQRFIGKIADLFMVLVGIVMMVGGVARGLVSLKFYSELPATGLPSVVQDFAIPMAGLLITYASIMNFLDLNGKQNPLMVTFDPEKAAL